ncbi:PREDICTED: sister chromatid cohesion protein DCC1-like [Nelumbo nucifera]|uniref:Sister chromatid cohesion protein DCC1 n=2 Tax=Nelumbo nucifera TaxID=4432 RepID=A0A822Y959_NELNU|nr:PREDICTED: sister chromatid cohesion protein DCC1-like [Nelumbo nucifera]DAD26128.1 TPA_asm: hypothetical protein HUJ06_027596 [Nelumbo nucifera]
MEHESCRGGAKAMLNLQPNSSISTAYHPHFGPHDDLMLLEIDEKLLPDILHNRVSLRGQSDEEVVLCTPSKTYAVKLFGTSNFVFLVPPSDPSESSETASNEPVVASVLKVALGIMELVEVAPKLDKLKLLLMENPYRPEDEMDVEELEEIEKDKMGLFRWEDLVDRIQASDEELRAGLRALLAVEIDGYWRIVDEKYMDIVLSMLLHNAVLNGWSLNALKEDEVVGMLEADGFPRRLALHCLEMYGGQVREGNGSNGRAWVLDERWVCIHFARVVLKGGKMKMESFMDEWMKKIPARMSASFEMLEGEVLVERLGVETWIRAFSVSSLPSTPVDRFVVLFRERQKWEWKDLQPYIRDLRIPGLPSKGLLLKYTRKMQPTSDAEPVFSAR